MAHLGKLFAELLQNAGYDIEAENEALGAVLAIDTDIPDDAATVLKSNLLTLESAKHNPDIKKHFTAQALNTVDTTLSDFANEYGEIPQEKLDAINAEKSSYKKTAMMLNALKEVERSKAAGGNGAGEETQKQLKARKEKIEQLTQELTRMKESHEQALNAERQKAASRILDFAQNTELGMRDFANKDLDKSTNVLIARQIVDSYLNEIGAMPVPDENGSIKLVQASDPDMDFMLENKNPSYGSLADKILSEKKILSVSDPAPAGNGNHRNQNPQNGAPSGQPVNQEISAAYEQQIAQLTGQN